MGSAPSPKFRVKTVEGFFLQDEPDVDAQKLDYVRVTHVVRRQLEDLAG